MRRGPVISLPSRGSGSMGSIADRTSICRYSLPAKFTPVHFRANFTGGTGSATLTLSLDSQFATNARDVPLLTMASIGTSGSTFINKRWPFDEMDAWVFDEGDDLVVAWANPDVGNMLWNIDFGLARVIGDGS